ncbi:MAG TPA: MgtC/SapB family protein [Sedimentisphaerales bacterium]|nr:MgtC/SapB family protein [Sedimentisphaerales bacterium]
MDILKNIVDISPFNWLELLSAMIAGTVVGLERQLSGKPIGIRTSILICISTYAFTTFCGINNEPTLDLRIIGQIITGIGFLGAGVILTRGGIVIGVTSAACIWILAAIGITIGTNHPATGIKLSLLAVIILTGVDTAEKRIKSLRKGLHEKYSKVQN